MSVRKAFWSGPVPYIDKNTHDTHHLLAHLVLFRYTLPDMADLVQLDCLSAYGELSTHIRSL